ncbi:MAG: hypothetical protein OEY44_01010 [Candidatus Peregrinibacteria bacterium]|nr:hypothetical protein [Candidatus Peregrinibacteria bacterium]
MTDVPSNMPPENPDKVKPLQNQGEVDQLDAKNEDGRKNQVAEGILSPEMAKEVAGMDRFDQDRYLVANAAVKRELRDLAQSGELPADVANNYLSMDQPEDIRINRKLIGKFKELVNLIDEILPTRYKPENIANVRQKLLQHCFENAWFDEKGMQEVKTYVVENLLKTKS